MKKQNFSVFLLSLFVVTGPWAYADNEDLMDYDAIVNDLKGSNETKIEKPSMDPFDSILLYSGLGLATSHVSVRPELGGKKTGFLTGVEVNFGIDLFSREWQAETSLRSFNSEKLSPDVQVSVKEFDLKIMNTTYLSHKLKLRLGGGLAARYMKMNSPLSLKQEYTTPASILDAGLRAQITPLIGVGGELSYRSALIDESVDRSALHAAVRVDAQF